MPTARFPFDNARASAGSLSPLGTVLLTPVAASNADEASTIRQEPRRDGCGWILKDVRESDGLQKSEAVDGTAPHRDSTEPVRRKDSPDGSNPSIPDTSGGSQGDVVLDFTRFQKPVARVIQYDSITNGTTLQPAADDPFLDPFASSWASTVPNVLASNSNACSSLGQQPLPRFVSPNVGTTSRKTSAIPVEMIPIKDIDQISAHGLERSPSLHSHSLLERSSRIMLKARPSMGRLSRAFEQGFSKTLAVFGGRKHGDGKVALLADIETYRGTDHGSPAKAPGQKLGRSFSNSMLDRRPSKRNSMDSGFSWSPKTWRKTPSSPASELPLSPIPSPKTIRRRPRLPSFRLSSLSHLMPKDPTETLDSSASGSGHKRSDSEESWGNATQNTHKNIALCKDTQFLVTSRIQRDSHAGDGVVRKSTLRLLKHGSAWGAMKRISRKRPAQQELLASLSTSSNSESMSESSMQVYTNHELEYQEKRNSRRQDARMGALAILEGREGCRGRQCLDEQSLG